MIIKIKIQIKLIESNKRIKNIMQGCIYKKYYLKIIFFILKNKVHPYKRLKKIINE
jgi:hypothetical protein